jgi:hypothetical protein
MLLIYFFYQQIIKFEISFHKYYMLPFYEIHQIENMDLHMLYIYDTLKGNVLKQNELIKNQMELSMHLKGKLFFLVDYE